MVGTAEATWVDEATTPGIADAARKVAEVAPGVQRAATNSACARAVSLVVDSSCTYGALPPLKNGASKVP
jgi:hypothetical protein